jgi:hypothetical protein
MKIELVYALLALVWAIINFSFWTKRKDKDLLWLAWIGAIGFLAESSNYFFRYIFYAPSTLAAINLFLMIFGPASLLVLVWIGYKMLKGDNRG